jgi:hypothetical protein
MDEEHEYGLKAIIDVKHWHIIPGGIEFEDANGAFVHVLMTEEQWEQVAEHMQRIYRAPL